MNGVFGVIGPIPEFRKNFALDFCSLITLLRTKIVLITPLRKKIGEITHYATTKRAHHAAHTPETKLEEAQRGGGDNRNLAKIRTNLKELSNFWLLRGGA